MKIVALSPVIALALVLLLARHAFTQIAPTTLPSTQLTAGSATSNPASRAAALQSMREPARVLALGNGDDYFLGVIEGDGSKASPLRTLIRHRGLNDAKWHHVVDVPGRAAGLSIMSGKRLVVRMDDGTWFALWDGGSSAGQPLPASGQLLDIAGDDHSLWSVGIVTGGMRTAAADVKRRQSLLSAASSSTAPTSLPATNSATLPVSSRDNATDRVPRLVLFSMEATGWVPRAQVPLSATGDGISGVSLAVSDGRPIIAVALPDGHLDVYQLGAGDDVGPVIRLPSLPNVIVFKMLAGPAGKPLLWRAQADGPGFLQPLVEGKLPIALPAPEGESVSSNRAIATALGFVRVVYAPPADLAKPKILEQRYDFDGVPQGSPLELVAPPTALAQRGWALAIQTGVAVIAILLIMSSFRKRSTNDESRD